MGKPYSDDLRECVVAAIEAGHTRVEVAELYNIALSTVGGFIKDAAKLLAREGSCHKAIDTAQI